MSMFSRKKPSKDNTITLERMIDGVEDAHPYAVYKHRYWRYLMGLYKGSGPIDPELIKDEALREEAMAHYTARYNVIRAYVEIFVSKMFSGNPVPQAKAATNDPSDVETARAASLLLKHHYEVKGTQMEWVKAVTWATVLGLGGVHTHWSGYGGEPYPMDYEKVVPPEVAAIKESLGASTGDFEESESLDKSLLEGFEELLGMGEGDVYTKALDMFSVYPDHRAKSVDEIRNVVTLKTIPLSDIFDFYGNKHRSAIKSDTPGVHRHGSADIFGGLDDRMSQPYQVLGEESVVLRCYYRRGFNSPHKVDNGKVIVRAGGVTLYDGDNPNPDVTKLPFSWVTVKSTPDILAGTGLVEGLIEPVGDYSRMTSIISDGYDQMGDAIFDLPAGVSPKDFEGVGPRYVNRPAGTPPNDKIQQVKLDLVPANAFSFLDFLRYTWGHVTGISDVSFSQLPERSSQMSGRVMEALMAAEFIRHAQDVQGFKAAMKGDAESYLALAKRYYTVPRIVSVAGERNRFAAKKFSNADLEGHFDVLMKIVTGFGVNEQSRQDRILGLLQSGVITNPRAALNEIDQGMNERLNSFSGDASAKYARVWEETVAADGKNQLPFVSRAGDDHGLAIETMQSYIQSPSYNDLSDEVKKKLEEYMNTHAEMMQPPPGQEEQGAAPAADQPAASQTQFDQQQGQA